MQYNFIVGNQIREIQSGNAIAVQSSAHNYIPANQITESGATGIGLYSRADWNWAIGNNASRMSLGISIVGNDNVIELNDFDNTMNGYDAGQGNQWSYGGRGNYWSDYTGTSQGVIGSVPYQVKPDGVDNYPLVSPNGGVSYVELILHSTFPDISFSFNGTKMGVGPTGMIALRLSYFGNYNISFPEYAPVSSGVRLMLEPLDGISGNSTPIRLYENRTLQVVYLKQFYVTVTSPHGNATGTGWYDAGSIAAVSVQPVTIPVNSTFTEVFAGWSGSSNSQSSSLSLKATGPMELTAVWALHESTSSTTVTTSTQFSTTSTTTALPSSTSSTGTGPSQTSSTSSATGGGIPEFPFQSVASALLVSLVAASYLVTRRRRS